MDADNGFDVLQVNIANAANNTATVHVFLSNPRYPSFPPFNAVVD
jgi:hypothetical protein